MPASNGDRVVIDRVGRHLVITLSDAQKLQRMLISRVEASQVEDRDFLLAFLRSSPPLDFPKACCASATGCSSLPAPSSHSAIACPSSPEAFTPITPKF